MMSEDPLLPEADSNASMSDKLANVSGSTTTGSQHLMEEEMIDSLFAVLDPEGFGKVSIACLVEFLRFNTEHCDEGWSEIDELEETLLDKGDGPMIEQSVCRPVMEQWINSVQSRKICENSDGEDGPEDKIPPLSPQSPGPQKSPRLILWSPQINRVHPTSTQVGSPSTKCSNHVPMTPSSEKSHFTSSPVIGSDRQNSRIMGSPAVDIERRNLSQHVRELERHNRRLLNVNEQLRNQLDASEDSVSRLTAENEEINRALKSQQGIAGRYQEMKAENEGLKASLASTEDTLNSLNCQLNIQEREKATLEQSIGQLEDKVLQYSCDLEYAQQQYQETLTELSESKKQQVILEEITSQKDTEIAEKLGQVEELEKMVSQYKETTEVLKQEEKELQEQLVHLQHEVQVKQPQGMKLPKIASEEDLIPTQTPLKKKSLCAELCQVIGNETSMPSPICAKELETVLAESPPMRSSETDDLDTEVANILFLNSDDSGSCTETVNLTEELKDCRKKLMTELQSLTPSKHNGQGDSLHNTVSMVDQQFRNIEQQIKALEKSKKISEGRVMAYYTSMKKLSEENESLKQCFEHDQSVRDLAGTLDELNENLQQRQQENAQLLLQLEQIKNELETVAAEREESVHSFHEAATQVITLRDELRDVEWANSQLTVKYKDAVAKGTEMKESWMQASTECQQHKDKAEKLQESLDEQLSRPQIDLKDLWRLAYSTEADSDCASEDQETPITVSYDSLKHQLGQDSQSLKNRVVKKEALLAALLKCRKQTLNLISDLDSKNNNNFYSVSPLIDALSLDNMDHHLRQKVPSKDVKVRYAKDPPSYAYATGRVESTDPCKSPAQKPCPVFNQDSLSSPTDPKDPLNLYRSSSFRKAIRNTNTLTDSNHNPCNSDTDQSYIDNMPDHLQSQNVNPENLPEYFVGCAQVFHNVDYSAMPAFATKLQSPYTGSDTTSPFYLQPDGSDPWTSMGWDYNTGDDHHFQTRDMFVSGKQDKTDITDWTYRLSSRDRRLSTLVEEGSEIGVEDLEEKDKSGMQHGSLSHPPQYRTPPPYTTTPKGSPLIRRETRTQNQSPAKELEKKEQDVITENSHQHKPEETKEQPIKSNKEKTEDETSDSKSTSSPRCKIKPGKKILRKAKAENLAKKRVQLQQQSKMPELSEAAEMETGDDEAKENKVKPASQGAGVSEDTAASDGRLPVSSEETDDVNGDDTEDGDNGHSKKSLSSVPQEFLRILNMAKESRTKPDSETEQEDMSEKDIEDKFTSLSLAFKTDHQTLQRRIQLQEHARDVAEENLNKEVHGILDALKRKIWFLYKSLGQFCTDKSSREIYTQLKNNVNVLEQAISRMCSRAETLGAVHQELRMSVAMEAMVQYVESLKRVYEREHNELEEAKKLIQESKILHSLDQDSLQKRALSFSVGSIQALKAQSSTAPHQRHEAQHLQRSTASTPSSGSGGNKPTVGGSLIAKAGKRRASVAAFPRTLPGMGSLSNNADRDSSMDARNRFQNIIGSTGMKAGVVRELRRSSLEQPSKVSDSSEQVLSSALSPLPTQQNSEQNTANESQPAEAKLPKSTGSSDPPPEEEGPEPSQTKTANHTSAKTDHNSNLSEASAYHKGFEEGVRVRVGRDLAKLREQQQNLDSSIEDILERTVCDADIQQTPESRLERLLSLWPGWDKSMQCIRYFTAGMVFLVAVFCMFFSLLPSTSAVDRHCYSEGWISFQDTLDSIVQLRYINGPPPT